MEAISRGLNRLAEHAMAVLLAAMTVVTGLTIAGRFVFAYSLFWSDEVTRFLLIWVSFLGMSVGVRHGAHPGIDSLVRRCPPRTGRVVRSCAAALSALFFVVMVAYGGSLAARTWAQRSPSLGLRMSVPYLAVPVAGLLMLLHAIALWRKEDSARAAGGGDG